MIKSSRRTFEKKKKTTSVTINEPKIKPQDKKKEHGINIRHGAKKSILGYRELKNCSFSHEQES